MMKVRFSHENKEYVLMFDFYKGNLIFCEGNKKYRVHFLEVTRKDGIRLHFHYLSEKKEYFNCNQQDIQTLEIASYAAVTCQNPQLLEFSFAEQTVIFLLQRLLLTQ